MVFILEAEDEKLLQVETKLPNHASYELTMASKLQKS